MEPVTLFGCSNHENEGFEISRKKGRGVSCVSDSEKKVCLVVVIMKMRVLRYLLKRAGRVMWGR